MSTAVRPLVGPSPMPVGTYDLADLGYVEEEFLLEGTAESYRLVGEREGDGRWKTETSDAAAYTTRVLVRRPVESERFSGTVVVEWNNVSGGVDVGPDWSLRTGTSSGAGTRGSVSPRRRRVSTAAEWSRACT